MFSSLLLLLFSLSLRSANLENIHVYDYEIMSGIKNGNSKVVVAYERENGIKYTNSDVVLGYKYFDFTSYKKSAKKFDRQKFSFLYPSWKGVRVGLTYGLKKWKDPTMLITVEAKGELFSIRHSKGINRVSTVFDLKKPIKFGSRVNLVPTVSIRRYDDELFYQAKVGFEYILHKKKEVNKDG